MIGEPEELKLSDNTTVFVAELDGWEQDLADSILCQLLDADNSNVEPSSRTLTILQAKVYAIGSIRRINGENVEPLRNKRAYALTSARLGLAEKNVLGGWAMEKYMGEALALVKNAL